MRMKTLGIVAVSLGLWAVASVAPAFARQPDAWITTKVKSTLIVSKHVGGFPINVDTNDGIVTLSGKVSSKMERAEAERLARAASDVRDVRNLLQVVPGSRRKSVGKSDDRIEEAVEAALKGEPRLENSSIGVKSVHKGVVLLDGKAASMSDHLLALEIARRVDGARSVASEIESPDTFGDREVWYDDTNDADHSRNSFGDAWLTGKTKFRFMTDPEVPARDINVDTWDGVVTLFGTVPSTAVKSKAMQIARDVSGVKAVRNELLVVPKAKKKIAREGDGDLTNAIEKRLQAAEMDGADIKVQVRAGVARLTGTVKRPVDRYDAVVIARTTDGVAAVHDDIRISS
ncbi:MAG TPA: BON domain-containing protein [Candidatus Eisenbacteria bacterium]|nr:BON domain-containing protein [Candidatus Eisenbacteria bacterium]